MWLTIQADGTIRAFPVRPDKRSVYNAYMACEIVSSRVRIVKDMWGPRHGLFVTLAEFLSYSVQPREQAAAIPRKRAPKRKAKKARVAKTAWDRVLEDPV